MRKPSPRRRFRPLALEPIEPRRLLAFAAELVADVNATQYSPQTDPREITDVSGIAFYTATTAANGRELWRSDGTLAGTMLVKDIVPGSGTSNPTLLTNVNGTLYFAAETEANGQELWRSDGTAAGTYRLKDIFPGPSDSFPRGLTNVDGTLFFSATDDVHGNELWTSDGTEGGTVVVRDINQGSAHSSPTSFHAAAGFLFFIARESNEGNRALWRSDGTAEGTLQLTQDTLIGSAAEVNGKLFFGSYRSESNFELWSSDGTAQGTDRVFSLPNGNNVSYLHDLTNVNGTLFFTGNDGTHGPELWKSDGTTAGTVMVSDRASGFLPEYLINGNGTLFFISERVLWKSDGSSAGTVFIGHSTSNGGVYIEGGLTSVDGIIYFAANDWNFYGTELWKSDGTRAGTTLVKDIFPGIDESYDDSDDPNDSNPKHLTAVGGKLFFNATDSNGSHLWISDGTDAGTQLVDFVGPRTHSANVKPELNLNGKLILTGATDDYGVRAFISDGTAAGTHQLGNKVRQAGNFANINGIAYFAGSEQDRAHSELELWKTDGTAEGTVLVKDIQWEYWYGNYFPHVYYYGSNPSNLIELNDKVLFGAKEYRRGGRNAIWTSDGTSAGTTYIASFSRDDVVDQLTRLGNYVLFTVAEDGGSRLYRTDGSFGDDDLIKAFSSEISPGATNLFVYRNSVYFSADDGTHGRELWQSDGTAAGTVMLRDFVPGSAGSGVADFTEVRGSLYFTTRDDAGDKKLWKTDGTAAGIAFIADIGPAKELTDGNGTLYFSTNLGGTGYELWKSNGTAAGTRLVKDLAPGPDDSDPDNLQEINGVLFFEATSSSGKRSFWISNGTSAGTHQILASDTVLTQYQFLTNVNGQLFFAGTDYEHGQELWKLSTAHPTVQFSGTLNYRENDPLKLIAPFAKISDADNTAFSGGTLSVLVAENAGKSDRVEIRHQGNDPGQIGVSGRTIRYGGVVIGSYRDGLSGSQLIIDLNAQATVAATQALVRNIGYRNTSDNPSTKPRTITVTLTDGSGGISQPISKTISVQAVNDPPRLVLGGSLAYKNNSSAILLAAAATVSDPDSANFFGGVLTVDLTSGRGPTNRLLVGGAYSIESGQLLRNGVVVGEVLEDGVGWHALRLRFNSQMTPSRVQELVRSLRFRAVDNTNLDPRIISFTLTDGDGGVSATQTKTVNVTN